MHYSGSGPSDTGINAVKSTCSELSVFLQNLKVLVYDITPLLSLEYACTEFLHSAFTQLEE